VGTNRVNEAILESKGYLKKNAKTDDVSAESTFDTDTYLAANHDGGNEDIVLKRWQAA
jgi:hypothetical protein